MHCFASTAPQPPCLVVDGAKVFILTKAVLIGRDPYCDLVLEGDEVSRRHALVHEHLGRWWVLDLASRNGVNIDGQRMIGPQELQAGIALKLGHHNLSYFDSADACLATTAPEPRVFSQMKLDHTKAVPLPEPPQTFQNRLLSFGLTLREVEVMFWLCEGKADSEIAAILMLSPSSIGRTLENIQTKLDAPTRADAIQAVRVLAKKAA
jgi:DNA-binding CsgD family transcriptional regulator